MITIHCEVTYNKTNSARPIEIHSDVTLKNHSQIAMCCEMSSVAKYPDTCYNDAVVISNDKISLITHF